MSFNVIGIGEVLWDLLPDGPQLGGAPANFACHARALQANATVISRVGNDDLGQQVLQRFRGLKLPLETVQVDPEKPTGTVTVSLNGSGIPHFCIHENVAWDRLTVSPPALAAVRAADAVCFGSLAQRNPVSRAAIQQLLAAAPAESLRVFDINLRQNFYSQEVIEQSLRLANVLKLNTDELPVLAGMFALAGDSRRQIERLAEFFELKLVVLTRGAHGSLIYKEGDWSEQTSKPVKVADTVGAGDSFTAALIMGLLVKMDLEETHSFAADVARFVCSQPGATPLLPIALQHQITGRNCLAAERQLQF